MIPFSVLDLSNIIHGGTAAEALNHSRDLARHVEALGFRRFWMAEHHNMPGIASAATAVALAHVAAATFTIRLGAGGIMLPNHSPLVVAEQFGTLAALYPGRIDLGIGRAPGTDQATVHALRRGGRDVSERFAEDVMEVQAYFQPTVPEQLVQAVPGAGLEVPLWILGSSLFGAQLAAALGLPFAFASHFAPDHLERALALYRQHFQPSTVLEKPYAMAAIGVVAADTDAEAARLFTSLQQSFVWLHRGKPLPLPPPVDNMNELWNRAERGLVHHAFREAVVGSPATVRRGLEAFLERTRVDELMVTAAIFDRKAHLWSYKLIAEVRDSMFGKVSN